jgi:hypothetical protein
LRTAEASSAIARLGGSSRLHVLLAKLAAWYHRLECGQIKKRARALNAPPFTEIRVQKGLKSGDCSNSSGFLSSVG